MNKQYDVMSIGVMNDPIKAHVISMEKVDAMKMHVFLRTLRGKLETNKDSNRNVVLIADAHLGLNEVQLKLLLKAVVLTNFRVVGVMGDMSKEWAALMNVPAISDKPKGMMDMEAVLVRQESLNAIQQRAKETLVSHGAHTEVEAVVQQSLKHISTFEETGRQKLQEQMTSVVDKSTSNTQAEALRVTREQLEQERATRQRQKDADAQREIERIEEERLDAERLEQERLEKERLAEIARLEAARVEAERIENERLKQERIEQERAEQARLEAERIENERREAEIARIKAERLENERRENERLEQERLEQERLEARLAEEARVEQERLEAERIEQERLEAMEVLWREQERIEQERIEQEQREQEELAEQERIEAERLENERVEQERQEEQRLADFLDRQAKAEERQRQAQQTPIVNREIGRPSVMPEDNVRVVVVESIKPLRMQGRIRSGQIITHAGDVIIEGSVHAGGEIVASGDIHVYGKAGGRLLAGVTGDAHSCIYVQHFDAEMICIAGKYHTFEDVDPRWSGKSIKISLTDQKLVFEAMEMPRRMVA